LVGVTFCKADELQVMLSQATKSREPIGKALKLSPNGKQLLQIAADKVAQSLASTVLSSKLSQSLEEANRLEKSFKAGQPLCINHQSCCLCTANPHLVMFAMSQ